MNAPRDDTRALFGRSIGAALVSMLAASFGCGKGTSQGGPAPAASSTISGAESRVRALDAAADQRDPKGFTEVDVAHLDAAVRRSTARGLARLRRPSSAPSLFRLLVDRDPETVAFSAYGLGSICTGAESTIVPALVARAASFAAVASEVDARGGGGGNSVRLDPAFAIARALGQCGSSEAETALRGWLMANGPTASAAALGLGDVATKRKLADESVVALLGAAEKGNGEALFPFSRTTVEGASTTRVRDVATTVLGRKGVTRVLAVRALGRTDAAAVPTLAAVLARSREDTDVERAEAARALGRLGPEGQRALIAALPALAPGKTPIALVGLVADPFGPLTTVLDELRPPVSSSTLDELSELPIPSDAPAPVALRITRLRCAAAQLRADAEFDDARLRACDPAKGDLATLARLTVTARKTLSDPRRRAVIAEATVSPSARVRAQAYELVGEHPELENGWALLTAGLAHPSGGTVSAAADALAKRRDLLRGEGEAKGPSRVDLVKAVNDALARPFGPDETEVRLSLLELALLVKDVSFIARLVSQCASPAGAVREKARRALTVLGKEDLAAACDAPLKAPAKELATRTTGVTHIVLVTDAGELTLHVDRSGGAQAPAAAARLVELARGGFFKDMAVHRVVPGFVVQWGDKVGDGTGGADREPLRCETSPVPFGPLTIGVALAGRDTGSSQFFVTLSRVPHLDGAYTTIGSAQGDWAAVTEGDKIREVRVSGP